MLYLAAFAAAAQIINNKLFWCNIFVVPIFITVYLHICIRTKKITVLNYIYVLFYLIFYLYSSRHFQLHTINSHISETNKSASVAKGYIKSLEKSSYGIQIKLENCRVELFDDYAAAGEASDCSGDLSEGLKEFEDIGILVNYYNADSDNSDMLIEGSYVCVSGNISPFDKVRNEGGFDAQSYYKSIGIDCKMTADGIEILQESEKFNCFIHRLKARFSMVYEDIAKEEDASLLKAIVLGEKSDIDDELYSLYQKNGIAHILAISGLHISFIGMFVYKALRGLGAGYICSFSISAAVLSSYLLMTGGSASAKRAVIMCVISMGADVLGKSYDVVSAMSFAAIAAIFENVNIIYNSGFLLSYGAIMGIGLLNPVFDNMLIASYRKKTEEYDRKLHFIKRYLRECVEKLCESITSSLCITIITLPVILYQYFQLPLYSILLNVIVIPLMSVLLLAALAAVLVGLFSVRASVFMVGIAHYILNFYTSLCKIFENIPGNILVTGRPSLFLCVIYYVLLAAFIFVSGRLIKIKYKNVRRLLIIPAFALYLLMPERINNLRVDMIDVGQGDSILVRTDECSILFDAGSSDIMNIGKRRIYPFIRSQAIKQLDYIFVSHSDNDHINAITELMDMCDSGFCIKNIVLPDIKDKNSDENYMSLVTLAKEKGINVICISAETVISSQSGDLKLVCLHPAADYVYESTNDYSAVYLMEYDKFSMIFTGDVEESGEEEVVAALHKIYAKNNVSVLKTAHHGSKTSTSEIFLETINPELAIISCGVENRYGHPSFQTLERFEERKIKYLITSQDGQITITTDGKGTFKAKTKF